MRNVSLLALTFLLVTAADIPAVDAQTVTQAYEQIPDALIGYPEAPAPSAKLQNIEVQDDKRGYLRTKSGVEFAKFIVKQGGALFVVAGGSYAEDRLNRLVSVFARGKDGAWEDVTESYLPPIPDMVIDALFKKACRTKKNLTDSASGTYRFSLPRKKGAIKAVVESDGSSCRARLFSLSFDDTRFVMSL